MAYLSQGENNEDLVDKMILNGVLKSEVLIKAFRLTDRGDFINQNQRGQAYFDRPFKSDFIHMSAPHMYVTVLENLELKEGHSFLNIGSGTGYLSCLAACLLGDNGLSHGIDCNAEVVKHSLTCTDRWFNGLILRRQNGDNRVPKVSTEGVKFVHGNCFNIDVDTCSKMCKYDRIYIGAGCDDADKDYFYSLLSDDGIMVLPIDNRGILEKIVRKSKTFLKATTISNVSFASLIRPVVIGNNVNQMETTIVTAVPAPLIILPPLLWAPIQCRHKQFSKTFKDAVHTLLLSSSHTPLLNMTTLHNNIIPKNITSLPIHVITYIISFTSRDWFNPEPTEVQLLQTELRVERELRIEAEQKLTEALEEQKRLKRNKLLFRFILQRLVQRIGSSVSSVQSAGAYAMEALRSLRESSNDDFDFLHNGGPFASAINNIITSHQALNSNEEDSDTEELSASFTDEDEEGEDDDDGDDDALSLEQSNIDESSTEEEEEEEEVGSLPITTSLSAMDVALLSDDIASAGESGITASA